MVVAGKKQYFPGKKTTKMIFFEASMMCLLWSSPNTPFLRSTGRSKVVPNKTPVQKNHCSVSFLSCASLISLQYHNTLTHVPQYEQQNNIMWYQVGGPAKIAMEKPTIAWDALLVSVPHLRSSADSWAFLSSPFSMSIEPAMTGDRHQHWDCNNVEHLSCVPQCVSFFDKPLKVDDM